MDYVSGQVKRDCDTTRPHHKRVNEERILGQEKNCGFQKVQFSDTCFFIMCLKSKQKCPNFRHYPKVSEIRTKKFRFQTPLFV